MKTLGRVLIILVVTCLLAGAMYAAVSAGGASTTTGAPGFTSQGFQGERPEGFRDGGGERGERGGGSWLGVVKNIAIIGALVAGVVLLRRLLTPRPALPVKAAP